MHNNQAPLGPEQFNHNAHQDRYLPGILSDKIVSEEYSALFQRRYAPIDFQGNHVYVITGSDSGLLIKSFARNYRQQPLALLFIEDDHCIDAIRSECQSELEQMEHVELLSIDELKSALELRKLDNNLFTGRVSGIKANCAELDISGWYKPLNEQIHFAIESRRWLVVNTSVRLPFLEHRLKNLPEMTTPATVLNNSLPEQTVVVLAAGPSLDEHLPWIKQHRHELVLVAVSRISRRLQSVGLTPDFVVVIDPQSISFEVSREALAFSPAPLLVHSDQAVSQLVGQWPGPKVYMGARVPWQLESFEIQANATTVSNMAFTLAAITGAQQILLAGLDFCLDEAGHTHAQGNHEREKGVSLRTDMEEVVTNDGSVRLSSIDYYNSGKFLEKQVSMYPQQRVINLSAGAMRLQGIEHLDKAEIRLQSSQPEKILDDIKLKVQQASEPEQWLKQSIQLFHQFRNQMDAFGQLASTGKKVVKRIQACAQHNAKDFRKLHSIDQKIRKQYGLQRKFCLSNCGHLFANILETGVDVNLGLNEKSLDKSLQIYSAYLNSIKQMQSFLDDTEKDLQLRLQQFADSWSQDLVDHFLHKQLPLKILRTGAVLPEGARQAAEALYQEQLTMKTTRLQTVLSNMEVSESSLFATLNGAYIQRSTDKLTHYRNAIEQMRDFQHHAIYVELASAYLAEVQGDHEQAFGHYQNIIDLGETPLMEEALNRVAFLSVQRGDKQTAMLALALLCEINPGYLATLEQLKKAA